jgi:CCR4-NOT transcription complex subunit 9
MANAFPFGHDHQYDWRQHNAGPANTHHPAQQQQQQHAAAQHFGRLPAMNNAVATGPPQMSGHTPNDHQVSLLGSQDPQQQEDNRRTLEWIAQLLNPTTRETALLELSKKREQVPELALVLWHSFGTSTPSEIA